MTAVVSPTSLQHLPRWNSNGQGGLDSMSADEVSRMFHPRKLPQRKDSSSSMVSTSSNTTASSSSTTFSAPPAPPQTNGDAPAVNGDPGGNLRKKPARGLWPPSKAEPVSGISTARPQPLPTPSSGQSAASTMSAMHQPSPILPSQSRMQPQSQQNGTRATTSSHQTESHPILVLLPLTGTFERKHINIPYGPEVLRIGRQTNVKTVPTPVNGYFDSKVLSRQHAEVWASPEGNIMIRDVKSSNGTFVNGYRLSPENRDSEPHQLNEKDTLELGIDIVSEDQKSIVHHKVSARVEFAGIYGSGTNLIDSTFGDVDAGSGNGLVNPVTGQQISRGRGSSQGSAGGNGRLAGVNGNGSNAMGPQRQMNLWLNPITIEQVVKKLTTELRQAKQQSQDLHRTGDFFTTLLTLEPGQEPPQSLADHKSKGEGQPHGVSTSTKLDSGSPFSQPPAPPPQQPLPEKPDSAVFPLPDRIISQSPLKRSDTERPISAMSSPTRQEQPQASQILSLVEALSTAQREIDSQGNRVKQLEVMLNRERKARESAEDRARRLLEGHFPDKADEHGHGIVDEEAVRPPSESLESRDRGMTNGYHVEGDSADDSLSETSSVTTLLPSPSTASPEQLHSETKAVDASTSRLKDRLDLMVREMDEMKLTMESYKRRAEGAEEERNSLQEMVEKIRASSPSSNGSVTSPSGFASSQNDSIPSTSTKGTSVSSLSESNIPNAHNSPTRANGSVLSNAIPDFKDLERTVTSVLQQSQQQQRQQGQGVAMQSAPYASMLGVVLLGVGLMTWLNGWQKGER